MGTPVSLDVARKLLEAPAAPEARPAGKVWKSGVAGSAAGGFQSREKIVWEWPDPAERMIEEMV